MRNHPKYDGKLPDQIIGEVLHEVSDGNGGIAQYDGKQYQLTPFDDEMISDGWFGSIIAPAGAHITLDSTRDVPPPQAPKGNLMYKGFGCATSKR